jgi:hypothetical protein
MESGNFSPIWDSYPTISSSKTDSNEEKDQANGSKEKDKEDWQKEEDPAKQETQVISYVR